MNKLETLMKLAEMLSGDDAPSEKPKNLAESMFGEYVIIRSRDSGVHAGYLDALEGRHAVLLHSRRLWYWVAAKEHTLSAVSIYGLKSGSKISSEVDRIDILDVCEIISTTATAQESIEGMKSHDPS